MNKFYCSRCKIYFGDANKDEFAICPICKKTRDDRLNQISPEKFQCAICGCSFSNPLKTIPVCPNAHNHLGSKKELDYSFNVLHEGGKKARKIISVTVEEVKDKMGVPTY